MDDKDDLAGRNDGPGEDTAAVGRGAAAEARAAILTRRVAALEAVVALERRLRDVQEMATRQAVAQAAQHEGQADITVPRPGARTPVDDDATIPVPRYRPDHTVRAPSREPAGADAHDAAHPPSPGYGSAGAMLSGQSQPSQHLSHHLSHHISQQPSQHLRTQPSGSLIPALPPPAPGRASTPGGEMPLALTPGFALFEYRIDAVLGQGGFGITYLATDVNLNVKVAIKEYLPGDYATRASDHSVSPRWAEDNDFYLNGLECFLVEARTLATFRHSNIVRVARFFEAHRTAYMVLEYERGQPLKSWWDKHRGMPESQLLSLLQPLLDGLALVHESGYLHRDIKPDNIYVRKEDGSLVLLDFGAARLTVGGGQAMADVVTPGYAPAEQYEGGEQGPWTDIYALGATLYWMITGAKPSPAPERQQGVAPHVPAIEAGAERYSEDFLRAVDWALMLEPGQRPQSVQEFSNSLFAANAGSLGLRDALRVGELEGQKRLKKGVKGVRQLGRALWRPSSWPLMVKMTIAMVLAALLPMTITAYYNLNGSVAAVTSAELTDLERLAQNTAGRVAQLIGDSRHLSNYLASDPVFIDFLEHPSEARRSAVNARLDNLIRTNPDVQLMFVIDTGGTVKASSDATVTGVNLAFREYFQEAKKGKPFMTGVIIGTTAGKPGVYYANPVFDASHAVVGVVVLRIKGATISAILAGTGADGGRVPFMVDGDGVLVLHPDEKQLYRSLVPLSKEALARIVADQRFRRHRIENLHMPDLAKALIGTTASGSIRYHSTLSGGEEYAGYAPVEGHNWVVGVTEPRAQFEAPLRSLFQNVLYSVGIIGLVFLILALLFARSIVRPVQRLTEAANALKDGDYDKANIQVTSNDEIGRLARTFNVMIDVLRQRDRERERGKLGRKDKDGDAG
ncbi:HAMP domain-containing protein [Oxalobacteraceae bacterium]|nr:HAMP domain-containing protein [Oxalobacteraceae bacterium]